MLNCLIPRHTKTIACFLLVLLVAGCAGKVRVAAVSDAIGGPDSVTGRHDAYVQADAMLSDTERATYLVESANLVSAVETAVSEGEDEVNAKTLLPYVRGVVTRHNAYVVLDSDLTELATDIFTNEATLLLRVFDEANRESSGSSAIGEDSPLFD